jgi:hypothetical protein
MLDALGLRHPAHVVDHERARQPRYGVRHRHELVAAQVQLRVPADLGDARRDWLDHLGRGDRGGRIVQREAHAAHADAVELAQLRVRDRRMDDGDRPRMSNP